MIQTGSTPTRKSSRQRQQQERVSPMQHLYNEVLGSRDKAFIIQYTCAGAMALSWQVVRVNLDLTRPLEAQQLGQYYCQFYIKNQDDAA
eukprot:15355524-Ditylum_brightwellii.AAC.2